MLSSRCPRIRRMRPVVRLRVNGLVLSSLVVCLDGGLSRLHDFFSFFFFLFFLSFFFV